MKFSTCPGPGVGNRCVKIRVFCPDNEGINCLSLTRCGKNCYDECICLNLNEIYGRITIFIPIFVDRFKMAQVR